MADLTPLPFDSGLEEYRQQAGQLHEAWKAGEPDALQLLRSCHPHFLDDRIPWLPKKLADSEIQSAALEPADFELAVARGYNFRDWLALAEYVEAVTKENSPVHQFEAAVEAVIGGDVASLRQQLREHPELVRARSTRVTCFDPPVHRATLLHYVAANGVEGYRQKTPKNAVEVATALLGAGAEADALADLYGGQCTTMSLLVSSSHPAKAGMQVALVDLLLDFGASVEEHGSGDWTSPLMTALAFGFSDAAEALVRRGARVATLAAAAGLGRLAEAR
ncbi:MAG: ankyrin repeat domain-containing protein, partial [Candidatus Acidiferrales bacterium]